MAPEIPLDLQIEILKRLPAMSLMRFKCVSNPWSFLIRSRYFSKLYRPAAIPRRQPCVYMSMGLLEHKDCDSMEVCQNPGKSRLLALSSSNSADESLEPFLTIQGMGGEEMMIVGGLILYAVCRKACIYNPTTRQSVSLPAVKSIIFAQAPDIYNKYVNYFLGHDPVLDQYKVVCNVETFPEEESDNLEKLTSEHWVLVLEAGGCWKKIEFDQPPAHVSSSAGLCINGVIYYLACTRTVLEIVMSFDVRSEEFNMIQAPQLGDSVGFIEYDGKPTIVDHTYIRQNGLLDLWVMEDDGGKWSKKSLVLQPCQMHLLKDESDESIKELAVGGTTHQKGEIILSADAQRETASQTIELIKYLMEFNGSPGDLMELSALFSDDSRVAEAASIAQKLRSFAEEDIGRQGAGAAAGNTPGRELEVAVANLQDYCNELENRLLSRFDAASQRGDLSSMTECAKILSQTLYAKKQRPLQLFSLLQMKLWRS